MRRSKRLCRRAVFFVTTFFSGYVDEHDLVVTGGYPGKLRDLLGIWVEESDALPEGETNHFTWKGARHEAVLLCDLLHLEGAEVLATYEEDFLCGNAGAHEKNVTERERHTMWRCGRTRYFMKR